jgi:hypothetical protein
MPGIGRDAATISAPDAVGKFISPITIVADDKLTGIPKLTSLKLTAPALISTSGASTATDGAIMTSPLTDPVTTIWPCAQIETAESRIIAVANKAFIGSKISNSLTMAIFFFHVTKPNGRIQAVSEIQITTREQSNGQKPYDVFTFHHDQLSLIFGREANVPLLVALLASNCLVSRLHQPVSLS